jgi:hypothetical protein
LTLKDVREKMLAKAATSCLTVQDVKTLQFEPYEEGHELEIYPAGLAGFRIPYFKLDGKVDDKIFRFRILQDPKGWAAVTEPEKKPRRYTQPGGTQCGVYLPPLLDKTWAQIAKDPKIPVIITEGELKAACACKLGLGATIGLGGVYNWRSAREGQDLLPILDAFEWSPRDVGLSFDSDSKTNPMVRMAASRLAYVLGKRGALVRWIQLPPAEDGSKQGVDDFVYSFAKPEKRGSKPEAMDFSTGVDKFGELLMNTAEIGPGRELYRLNNEVAFIQSTAEVIELATGNVYSPTAFSEARYKNRTYNETLEANGKMTTKFAAKEWLSFSLRNDVTKLAYDPTSANMITEEGAYNTWHAQRWPLTPMKTFVDPISGAKRIMSTAPWERLFKQVFGDLSEVHQLWVRQWFAYPIQKPGTKLYTAMLVWGRGQGIGKSLIAELMEDVYGRNYGLVNHDQLMGTFTEWAENKQFILGDEISVGDKRGIATKLKEMITRRTIRIDIKNRKTYTVRDCINFYFTSNSENAIYIENDARRYFIHNVEKQTMSPPEYVAIRRWWREEGGAARMFHYFKHEVDLGAQEVAVPEGTVGAVKSEGGGYVVHVPAFEPTAPAPVTLAKQEMAVAGRSEIEEWAFELVRDPSSFLKSDHLKYDLFRTEDLLKALELAEPNRHNRVGHKGVAAALANAGVFKIANGQNGAVVYGSRTRLWALRNVDRYRKMGAAEAGRAYTAERPKPFLAPSEKVGRTEKYAAKDAKVRVV